MKALEQNYKTGALDVVDVPHPRAGRGRVVVRTAASLASVGTEKSMVELARKSLLGKARARPDLVRQVIEKIRTDGILETWRQVMGRLDTPILLGYSSSGTVTEVGPGVSGFKVGDRVACTGSGYAGHAEVVSVPSNLCAAIPGKVDFEDASFVALGGIALESVRMAGVELGSRVVVIGLGLLGQITVQLLRASGCHVFGIDLDSKKATLAAEHGAETTRAEGTGNSAVQDVSTWSAGHGADAVIITASSPNNEPLEAAAAMCRERGRIVATGLVGLDVPRKTFYDKELELVVSRGWGPGLYDPDYTSAGVDYPLPYARWTAQRNAEEFLSQLANGAVSVRHLVTHRFAIEQAAEAYETILEGQELYIGVVFTYPGEGAQVREQTSTPVAETVPEGATVPTGERFWLKGSPDQPRKKEGTLGVGVIGAGLFANGTLLPAMRRLKEFSPRGIAANTGLQLRHAGKRFGFAYCATETRHLLDDGDVDLVMILTRHDSHAKLLADALAAGKHVFVEKPLAMDEGQLRSVADVYRDACLAASARGLQPPVVMVGFNRRFSPLASWVKERFEAIRGPLSINCLVNAGAVPVDSWVSDPQEGGGRIIGEVCHFVDLVQYLTSSRPTRVHAERVGGESPAADDSVVTTLTMADGSIASIAYLASGDKRHPRERVEIFGGGAVAAIDNFKAASFVRGGRRRSRSHRMSVDRGHIGELRALAAAINGEGPAVEFEEYVATTLATLAMERSLVTGHPEAVGWGDSPEKTEAD